MTDADYVPERGDIVWMVLEPRVGHEQSGRRPVLVLSPKELARHTNLAVICPITSKIIGLPQEVELTKTKTKGAILPFHVRSVDFRSRRAKYIEKAPTYILEKAVKGVQNIILPG
ncbi:MAG TPA: type II toxin-antitoxin system PemK/MazF family toxin [Candidatus Sulfotelmatobacter sp.]|nr:type II toxin-antitoxin system PemK/MazF family toxin [Candidatus Sulfotelmatobacter sp.]